MMDKHGPNCKWDEEGGEPCREFSTDGTRLGAQIAHTMGTTDEQAIADMARVDANNASLIGLTGMDEEQADWEDGR